MRAELRLIDGGRGKPRLLSSEPERVLLTCERLDAGLLRLQHQFDRMHATLQAILAHLEGRRPLKGPPMSEQRRQHVRTLMERDITEERDLPADVPLHQRGFGVMDEPPA